MNCGECKQKITRDDSLKIKCNGCSTQFHGGCVKVAKKDLAAIQEAKLTWSCAGCKSRRLSFMREDLASSSPSISSLSKDVGELRALCEPVSTLSKDVRGLRDFCEKRFSYLEELCEAFKKLSEENIELKKMVQDLQSDNSHLREITEQMGNDMAKLDGRVEQLQQQANLSSVEIHGLPNEYKSKEDTTTVAVGVLRESLGVNLTENDIISCSKFQVGPRDRRSSMTLVKFVNQRIRSKVMMAKREKLREKGGIFVNGEKGRVNVFINERLTSFRGGLLRRTREMAREKKYRFVWVMNGVVKVRRSDGENVIFINSEKDLTKLK